MSLNPMKSTLSQYSLVIAGDRHNPTILNHDFLETQEIVPKSWNWERGDDIVVTPAFTRVSYKNGVVIQVDPIKAQFSDHSPKYPDESSMQDVVKKFVNTLKHVRYKAVGVNFHSFINIDSPDVYVLEHFCNKSKYSSISPKPTSMGLRLVFNFDKSFCYLTIEPGAVKHHTDSDKTERPALIIHGNFHTDCEKYPADEEVIEILNMIPQHWIYYQEIINNLFSGN